MLIEIEVDSLAQLAEALPAGPDLVLVDNMSPGELIEAVACRDALAPAVELEASGGVNLSTVRAIAETGVERISAGALTHSAVALDVALDWERQGAAYSARMGIRRRGASEGCARRLVAPRR